MSVKLRIPDRLAPSLAAFVRLAPDKLTAFLKAIRERKPTLALTELAESLACELSLEREQVDHVVRLLTSFQAAREGFGVSVSEFVSDLRAAIEIIDKEEFRPGDWGAFENAITEALAGDNALAISSKAVDLMQEQPCVYCSARVLTDLRPVFGSSVSQDPITFIVVHTLKIVHHDENDDHREFFVALDTEDVKRLAALLDRALKKEEALRNLTPDKRLNILEVPA